MPSGTINVLEAPVEPYRINKTGVKKLFYGHAYACTDNLLNFFFNEI